MRLLEFAKKKWGNEIYISMCLQREKHVSSPNKCSANSSQRKTKATE
jgi:hypothetical protein